MRWRAASDGGRLILRLNAYGLAVAAAQAALVGSGVLEEWPITGFLW